MSRMTGAKHVFEIVVIVGRIVARAALGGGEGRELADEAQQLLVQPLGMDVARAAEVLQHRDVPVEQLQHEIVDALQAAAGGRIGGVAGELLELVVDPADARGRSSRRPPDGPRRSAPAARTSRRRRSSCRAPRRRARWRGRHSRAWRSCAARSARRGWAMSISSSTRSGEVESISISVAGTIAAGALRRAVLDLARVRRRDRHRQPDDLLRPRSPAPRSAAAAGCRRECRRACRPA